VLLVCTEIERRKVAGCLDPLTKDLITFADEEDLAAKIDRLYDKLDEDESGGKHAKRAR
jgi:hypothetical protein